MYKELFDIEQKIRTDKDDRLLKEQNDKNERLLKEQKYKEDTILRKKDRLESIALQKQIKKAMCNDEELAEYISLLDKRLTHDEYKRYTVLKTSYWYYKQEAEKELKKEMFYNYEDDLNDENKN